MLGHPFVYRAALYFYIERLYTYGMTQTMTPSDINPAHEVRDEAKLADLTASMRDHGWTGAPIVAAGDQALTGSHRIAAAQAADIEIPVVQIADLMAEHGESWCDLVAEHGMGDGYDWYEAGRWLDYLLPADVVEYYGLDLH